VAAIDKYIDAVRDRLMIEVPKALGRRWREAIAKSAGMSSGAVSGWLVGRQLPTDWQDRVNDAIEDKREMLLAQAAALQAQVDRLGEIKNAMIKNPIAEDIEAETIELLAELARKHGTRTNNLTLTEAETIAMHDECLRALDLDETRSAMA
jgi:hypothetical protein